MAISSISSITLPNGSTYVLKDASLRKAGILSGDGADIIGVDEVYFRPTIKVFDAAPVRSDLSVIKLSADEYMGLVASDSTLSNALYVVEDDYKNAYGQQIKNVAGPTDLSDAVNKEYVDSNFQPAGNYLTAIPAAYKTYDATLSSLSSDYSLTSHIHSNYVPTSRTVAGMQLTGNVTLKNLSFGSKSYNGSVA